MRMLKGVHKSVPRVRIAVQIPPVLASQRAWMSTILDYPTKSSSDSRETDESSSITMYLVRVV